MKSDFTLHSNLLFKKPLCTAGTQSTPREGGHGPSFFTHPGCYPTVWWSPVRLLGQAGANIRLHCWEPLLSPRERAQRKLGTLSPFLPASSCLSCSTLCPHPFITHKRQREKLSPGARRPSQPPSGFYPKQQAARQWDLRGKLRLPE